MTDTTNPTTTSETRSQMGKASTPAQPSAGPRMVLRHLIQTIRWWAPPFALACGLWGWHGIPGWAAALMAAGLGAVGWPLWLGHLRADAEANRPQHTAATPIPKQVITAVMDRYRPLLPETFGHRVDVQWQIRPCPHAVDICREPACNVSAVVPALPEMRSENAIVRVGEPLLHQPGLFNFAAIREIHHLVGGWRPLAYRIEQAVPIVGAFLIGYTASNLFTALFRYLLLVAVLTAARWIDEIACDRAAAAATSEQVTLAYFTHLDRVQRTGSPETAKERHTRRLRQLASALVCPTLPPSPVRAAAARTGNQAEETAK